MVTGCPLRRWLVELLLELRCRPEEARIQGEIEDRGEVADHFVMGPGAKSILRNGKAGPQGQMLEAAGKDRGR